MARITLSGNITNIAGSIGGTTYSNSLNGITAKNKPLPLKKNSQRANQAKLNSALVQRRWQQLTDIQREAWNNYALFYGATMYHNQNRVLSGQNVFYKYNYFMWEITGTIVNSPTFTVSDKDPVEITLTRPFGNFSINTDRFLGNGTEFLFIKLSSKITLSRNSAPGGLKLIKLLLDNSDTWNIAAYYQSVFGTTPTVGEKVIAEWLIVDVERPAWTLLQKQAIIVT